MMDIWVHLDHFYIRIYRNNSINIECNKKKLNYNDKSSNIIIIISLNTCA